jgi:predicted HicB family RNase H-like nuclease
MTIDDFQAKIEFDPDLNMYRGEILCLNGGADFYAKDQDKLLDEFKKSLQIYLQVCREQGIEPRRRIPNIL